MALEAAPFGPGRDFYPDQYNNPAYWKAHFEPAAPEIIHRFSGTSMATPNTPWSIRDGGYQASSGQAA